MSILNLKTNYFLVASQEYGILFFFIILMSVLGVILIGISYIVAEQKPEAEKFSVYECGFEPFDDARSEFEIKFYLVGILFVIFDLEIVHLLPWAISLNSYLRFYVIRVFILILVVGLRYEIARGALDW